jgi:hypothetical protein
MRQHHRLALSFLAIVLGLGLAPAAHAQTIAGQRHIVPAA